MAELGSDLVADIAAYVKSVPTGRSGAKYWRIEGPLHASAHVYKKGPHDYEATLALLFYGFKLVNSTYVPVRSFEEQEQHGTMLIQVEFGKEAGKIFVRLDDFFYSSFSSASLPHSGAMPEEIKGYFRSRAGSKGLMLAGFKFVWYAIEVAAICNNKSVEELIDVFEREDCFRTTLNVTNNDGQTNAIAITSKRLRLSKRHAMLYAESFGDSFGDTITKDQLVYYLQKYGVYWPFTREAVSNHSFGVASRASFVSYV